MVMEMARRAEQRERVTGRWRATVAGIVGLLFSAESCNQIIGIHDGVPYGDDPVVPCSAIADCAKVEAPECRVPVACDQGLCTYGDAPEGTLVKAQVPGDCAEIVCDGGGEARLIPLETDVTDDGNACTLDTCAGTTPVHTVYSALPCYTGLAGTKGKGICVEGIQHCDAQGNAIGECEGEVVPKAETCESPQDEDCDGEVNEEGADCTCGDGSVSTGEECDDGETNDGDSCSPTCKEQKALQVACGANQTCAILTGGSVKCWGYNGEGELGLGDTIQRGDGPNEMGDSMPAVNLGTGKTASAIAAGLAHACALLNDDSVKCWGANERGQLGLGDTLHRGDGPNEMGDSLLAVDLGAGKTASAIAAGAVHTCALLNDSRVKCWGDNTHGQLGLGDISERGDGPDEMGDNLPAVDLGAGKTASAIAAGYFHTCALLNDGSVKCWGHNVDGQLGLGDSSDRGDGPNEMGDNLPAVNLGAGKMVSAMAAGSLFTCALLNDSRVKCWGSNVHGQLGLGDTSHRGDGPNEMGDNLPAVNLGMDKTPSAIAAGFYHTCARLNDGSLKCWGSNTNGQLGLGDASHRGDGPNEMGDPLTAVDVGMGKTSSAMDAGGSHTCALLNDGSVKCWGLNSNGQLGLGDNSGRGDGPNEMGNNLPTTKLFSAFW
jgi:cysteine-rich repeat protein